VIKLRARNHDPIIDEELIGVGVNFIDHTADEPQDAQVETVDNDTGLWDRIKFQVLFLALTIGIGVCEYLGLMAEVIAVPSMCVCAACFGRNSRK
jgi:hypothetical protein